MTVSKIPLIYILGNGYSGSTLLDLLLGAHPSVWTLGEAQHLLGDFKTNRLCGCGSPIKDCSFWLSVMPNIPIDEKTYPIDYFVKYPVGNKYLRWDAMQKLHGKIDDRTKNAIFSYGHVNADYFKSVLCAAAKRRDSAIHWLVDASKDSDRLFWLQKSGNFDIRVIHLLKEPTAFVYSLIKRDMPHTWVKVIRMTGIWILENWISRRLCTSVIPKEHAFLLHYEELASQPEATLARIGKWLGLDFPPEVIRGFRKYENHAISGNQMRWQNADISLDEQWRTMLPASYQRAISIFTMPFRRMFGYE